MLSAAKHLACATETPSHSLSLTAARPFETMPRQMKSKKTVATHNRICLRRPSAARPPERLEERLCLSAFYDFDVIAQTGEHLGLDGDAPSINNAGKVAFVGNTGLGNDIFVGDGTSLDGITGLVDEDRYFNPIVQINDNDQIANLDSHRTIESNVARARIWNANLPGSSQVIALSSSGSDPDPVEFDDIERANSISNDGYLLFSNDRQSGDTNFTDLHLSNQFVEGEDIITRLESVPQDFPILSSPLAADGGRVLLVTGNELAGTVIDLFEAQGGPTSIAATAAGSWSQLGTRPGISDDGTVVVWFGDRGNGPGIFASVGEPRGVRRTIVIAGDADINGDSVVDQLDAPLPELGYDASGMPIHFSALGVNDRIGVAVYQNVAGNSNAIEPGESFVVSFFGTPAQASRNNPITGQPLLFTNRPGLWTVHVRPMRRSRASAPLVITRRAQTPSSSLGTQSAVGQ
jgi:hypothetical protein